jgi:hypothetical protein
LGQEEAWYVFVDTSINGKAEVHPWKIEAQDNFQVYHQGLRFRVGFRVSALGLQVQGSGLRV